MSALSNMAPNQRGAFPTACRTVSPNSFSSRALDMVAEIPSTLTPSSMMWSLLSIILHPPKVSR